VRDNMAQSAQNSDFLPAVITRSWLNQFAYGWPDFKLKVPNQRASYLPKRPILMLAPAFSSQDEHFWV
jgi:hypothetical protein